MSSANTCSCHHLPAKAKLHNPIIQITPTESYEDLTKDYRPKCPIMKQMAESVTNDIDSFMVKFWLSEDDSETCSQPDMQIDNNLNSHFGSEASIDTDNMLSPLSAIKTALDREAESFKQSHSRRPSNVSSITSIWGSEGTEDGREKIVLRGVIESIGTLLIPAVSSFH